MSITDKSLSRSYRALYQLRDILENPSKYPRDAKREPRMNRWKLKRKLMRDRRANLSERAVRRRAA